MRWMHVWDGCMGRCSPQNNWHAVVCLDLLAVPIWQAEDRFLNDMSAMAYKAAIAITEVLGRFHVSQPIPLSSAH